MCLGISAVRQKLPGVELSHILFVLVRQESHVVEHYDMNQLVAHLEPFFPSYSTKQFMLFQLFLYKEGERPTSVKDAMIHKAKGISILARD